LLSDGSVQNGYDVKILNMTTQPQDMVFSIAGLPGATLTIPGAADAPTTQLQLTVEPDLVLPLRVYVRAPKGEREDETDFTMSIANADGTNSVSAQVRFETPED
jgi:polyferredoxin